MRSQVLHVQHRRFQRDERGIQAPHDQRLRRGSDGRGRRGPADLADLGLRQDWREPTRFRKARDFHLIARLKALRRSGTTFVLGRLPEHPARIATHFREHHLRFGHGQQTARRVLHKALPPLLAGQRAPDFDPMADFIQGGQMVEIADGAEGQGRQIRGRLAHPDKVQGGNNQLDALHNIAIVRRVHANSAQLHTRIHQPIDLRHGSRTNGGHHLPAFLVKQQMRAICRPHHGIDFNPAAVHLAAGQLRPSGPRGLRQLSFAQDPDLPHFQSRPASVPARHDPFHLHARPQAGERLKAPESVAHLQTGFAFLEVSEKGFRDNALYLG